MTQTLSDYSVIVYDEDGKVVRESFGRELSNLEKALCDALDNIHALTRGGRIVYDDSANAGLPPRQPRTMGHG